MVQITNFEVFDIRFPTSKFLDGSDAMNPDPDYSAAYLAISTDHPDGHKGHGFVFTIGRGNDIQTNAILALKNYVMNKNLHSLIDDMGKTWKDLNSDSQLRWLGPEKGVMHMAIGAVINALWDLKAKISNMSLWQLLSNMSPEEIVSLVDFRYINDAITAEEALEILNTNNSSKEERISELIKNGYPAYTTTPGWLGYSDEKMLRLCHEAVAEGYQMIKLKVGSDINEDIRRVSLARKELGSDYKLAVDANQRWDVYEAIDYIKKLSQYNLFWVEEPTSPDDIIGHAKIAEKVKPIKIATGEHVHNRIIFKQMLQAKSLNVLQIDATRVAGVNENIAILLLAAKFEIPVCPHAGGVGLCEAVQHLSFFDYVAISGSKNNRFIEYVGHLHEHFVTPVDVHSGKYWPPTTAGNGMEMLKDSIIENQYSNE